MSKSSPLNDKIPNLVASHSGMSSQSPLNRQIAKSPLFVYCYVQYVTSEPMNIQSHLSLSFCSVHHLWTTRLRVWWFLISYIQLVTSELTDIQI